MSSKQLKAFEIELSKLFKERAIKVPIHLSGGNETQLRKIFKNIKSDDYVFSTHRNHYHYLLHTGKSDKLLRNIIYNKELGSMHTCDPEHNFYASGIVAGNCAMAVGVAWALREHENKEKRHVWCFIGDAAAETGHFLEALFYSYGTKLPITFVIEDNDRSVCTPKGERSAVDASGLTIFHPYCMYYRYTPEWPHAGIGEFVEF